MSEAAAEVIPLGTRLRQRREELGLTQAQAARQLDVARTAYRLWEMEAAKPAPDRWRTIARWLGISMTAMLLAEELIDHHEALEAGTAADIGRTRAARPIALNRDSASPWHPGYFRKRFPNDSLAPALARAALATTAIGIPADAYDRAALLTSELVTNSVKHSGSEWVEVAISVEGEGLRVEVIDQDPRTLRPRTPDLDGGWGLALVAELASRWGVDRHTNGKTVWVEFSLRPSD